MFMVTEHAQNIIEEVYRRLKHHRKEAEIAISVLLTFNSEITYPTFKLI